MSTPYEIFVGETFDEVGTMQISGPLAWGDAGINKNQPDFSQWTFAAALFDRNEKHVGSFNVVNLSNPALPSTNGLFVLSASAGETSSWPVGKLTVAVTVTSDAGAVLKQLGEIRVRSFPGSGQ